MTQLKFVWPWPWPWPRLLRHWLLRVLDTSNLNLVSSQPTTVLLPMLLPMTSPKDLKRHEKTVLSPPCLVYWPCFLGYDSKSAKHIVFTRDTLLWCYQDSNKPVWGCPTSGVLWCLVFIPKWKLTSGMSVPSLGLQSCLGIQMSEREREKKKPRRKKKREKNKQGGRGSQESCMRLCCATRNPKVNASLLW